MTTPGVVLCLGLDRSAPQTRIVLLAEAALADGSWLLATRQDIIRAQELLSVKAFLGTQYEGLKLERTAEFVVPRRCI